MSSPSGSANGPISSMVRKEAVGRNSGFDWYGPAQGAYAYLKLASCQNFSLIEDIFTETAPYSRTVRMLSGKADSLDCLAG
ncbi:hypothetical protein TWF481_002591 [Arthrobotrys musiformis]|uniref:Uncharacterized protein n=1 Tax=Arthrobotrys musiformis TaxID=47236 RepID=A0AAV9VRV0_9PEZI